MCNTRKEFEALMNEIRFKLSVGELPFAAWEHQQAKIDALQFELESSRTMISGAAEDLKVCGPVVDQRDALQEIVESLTVERDALQAKLDHAPSDKALSGRWELAYKTFNDDGSVTIGGEK